MLKAEELPAHIARNTPKQVECNRFHAAGRFLHFLTYGGARSTKTFRNIRLIVARALEAPGSRHGVFRATQKSIKASIQMDTLPKVMRLCYPGVKYRINKTDNICFFENGSEIWLCGMDNAERVEKILGMEFATLFFNEISELAHASVTLVWTRLAQAVELTNKRGFLRLLMLYDCNPPKKKHWAHLMFVDKIDPTTQKPLPNPQEFGAFQMNPADNPHLPEATRRIYQNLPPEQKKRFWDGLFGEAVEDALWNWSMFKPLPPRERLPDFRRIVIGVDPQASDGTNVKAETGIIAAGVGTDGRGYVFKDASINAKADKWAAAAVRLYHNLGADAVVGEINQGGDMVRAAIHSVDPNVKFIAVRATRGKVKRAEPVASLYAQGNVFHAPGLDTLENQMCDFTPDFDVALMGYSPDRVDALVWALTELMLIKTSGMGSMGMSGT